MKMMILLGMVGNNLNQDTTKISTSFTDGWMFSTIGAARKLAKQY